MDKAYRTLANKVASITLAGCWAHARRGFADLYKASKDPRAALAMRKIGGLYRLEKKVGHRPADKLRQWRKRYAKPILDDLWVWLTEQEAACPPGGALHKAIVYALSHRAELSVFLDDSTVAHWTTISANGRSKPWSWAGNHGCSRGPGWRERVRHK